MGDESKHCTVHYFLYGVQIIIVCIAVSVSLFKLFSTETDSQIWTSVLSSCIGYVLPNPTPKCKCVSSKKPSAEIVEEGVASTS